MRLMQGEKKHKATQGLTAEWLPSHASALNEKEEEPQHVENQR